MKKAFKIKKHNKSNERMIKNLTHYENFEIKREYACDEDNNGTIDGFVDLLAADLKNIAEKGIEQATKDVL